MATIVILQHGLNRQFVVAYAVHALAEHWRVRGHRVLEHFGIEDAPPADAAILHVDLTRVPDEYLQLAGRYRRVVNGAVPDVSKRRLSADLLARDSDWPGPAIVKTDANFGGRPERLLHLSAARIGAKCPVPAGPVMKDYPVYQSLRDVPDVVWTTPGLLVEKFLAEQDERGYYLRSWIFLGDREYSYRGLSNLPVMKLRDLRETQEVEVPEAMRAKRRELGFDFGSFDYARHGDRYVLFDANRTPGLGPTSKQRLATQLQQISEGIAGFLC